MKKITLCGEYYSSNFGDGIIIDANKYLLEKISNGYELEVMDFSCRKEYNLLQKNSIYKDTDRYRKIIKFVTRNTFITNILNLFIWYFKRKREYSKYYEERLQDSNLLIFSGGHILMNNSLVYPLRLALIVKLASKYKINIIFNSCGSEKTKNIIGKLILNRVLNNEWVKIISVRDNIKNIEYLAGSNISIIKDLYESNDPAICISQAYNIKRKETNTIGLGIISHLAYVIAHSRNSNKYLITEQELLNKWIDIINELVKRGYNCKIFSNGGYHDNGMAYKLQRKLENKIKVFIPKSPKQLVDEISTYKGVIAHRLHANIISYSLKVPTVGLVWDEKLVEFGKKTMREQYYINIKNYSSKTIVDLLEGAICEGVDEKVYNEIINGLIQDMKFKITKVFGKNINLNFERNVP